MSRVEVSCIIPTRDRAEWVGAAVESALSQTFNSVEVLVVDDGSRDETKSLLASFGSRIRVLETPGKGVAFARNLALSEAHGRYVAFLDADDWWHPEKIARQVDLFEKFPELGLCFTDYSISRRSKTGAWQVAKTSSHGGDHNLQRLLKRNVIGTLTVMIPRKIITTAGGFNPQLTRGSDYELWLRIAARYPLRRISGVLADYRVHARSLTGTSSWRDSQTYLEVISLLGKQQPGLFTQAQLDPESLVAAGKERYRKKLGEAV